MAKGEQLEVARPKRLEGVGRDQGLRRLLPAVVRGGSSTDPDDLGPPFHCGHCPSIRSRRPAYAARVKLFTQDTKVEALKSSSLFEDLGRADLARLAKTTDDLAVEAGRVLCHEGEVAREFYVIIDGEVDVTKGTRVLATLGPGDFFGELALLDHATRTATVTAKTPLRFFVLTSNAFWPLIESNPKLAHKLLRAVARRARTAFADPTV